MARIFLSHSSQDEVEAVAIRDWLLQNGWDDVFLDLDPQRGLLAGERWQEALKRAANQCEAVLFVVTPAWAKSKWCIAEFLLAKSLNKHIFGALLKPVDLSELPTEFTAEWQLTPLVGTGPLTRLDFTHQGQEHSIQLLTSGLANLRNGLERAGLDARYFPWPPANDPERAPYPGLKPLEAQDAAIYFGREVQILRAIETLRGMGRNSTEQLFIILSASGTGKSSFLRAGLLPRLKRDDRHFLPLQVIRPGQNVISGDTGLAVAIHNALKIHNTLGKEQTLGSIKLSLREAPAAFASLLLRVQQAAEQALQLTNPQALPPTLILAVDQAEELFSPDASSEAQQFLAMLGSGLGHSKPEGLKLIVVFTIRSDRYQPLQTAPELDGLYSRVFDDLKPLSRQRFAEIIAGPAERARSAGQALEITPELMEALLNENAEGADTLPLLALTLQLLYTEHNQQGVLRLESYQAIGGMAGVIENLIYGILSPDSQRRQAQLGHLHQAFIPWLVNISTGGDQPVRRQANYQNFPAESRELVDALVEKRLLLTDYSGGQTKVEIAHESLLRQWGDLKQWIAEERDNLKLAQDLEQASEEWQKRKRNPGWLWDQERLSLAEKLLHRPGYHERLMGNCEDFLTAARKQEDDKHADELAKAKQLAEEQANRAELQERLRKEAELSKARITKYAKGLGFALVVILAALVSSVMFYLKSQGQLKHATALRLVSEVQAREAGTSSINGPQGIRLLLAAHRLALTPQTQNGLSNALNATGFLQHILETNFEVAAVAFSPDGTQILSGSFDQTLLLWDAKTGQQIVEPLKGDTGWMTAVAFSADGTQLLSGTYGNTLRLWDAKTGQPIGNPLEGHNRVTAVAFSPDGTQLLSGGDDNTLRIWNAKTGQPIGKPLEGHSGSVYSVTFSPDGKQLLSGSGDSTLRLWDAKTGQPVGKPLEGHSGSVYSVTFSPDGKQLLSGSGDSTLRLWDAKTGQPIGNPLEGHKDRVTAVTFSPDGTQLLSGSADKTLRLWDAKTGQPMGEPLQSHTSIVRAVSFSPDGKQLLSSSGDKTLRLWNAKFRQSIGEPLQGHTDRVTSVTFSHDGTQLLSGSADKTLRRWDAKTRQPIGKPLQGHTNRVTSVAFSHDDTQLLSGSADKTLRLWDAMTGQPIGKPLTGHLRKVTSVAFSPDGKRLLSGSESWGKPLRLWDTETSQPTGAPLEGYEMSVTSVAFSPDGTRLLSGSDKTLRLWDAKTGKWIGEPLRGHTNWVTSVAFSPDGTQLLSGSGDNTLRLWDAKTGLPIEIPLQGHTEAVTSVAFSPDGKQLLSGSRDSTLRLWDAKTGLSIGEPLKGHKDSVTSVAFSPDGTQLLSGSDDTTLRLWPHPDTWDDLLCQKLTRNMSKKQWNEQVSPDIPYIEQCPGLPIAPDESPTKGVMQ